MGRPNLEELEARIKYDGEGKPASVNYSDDQGCGHQGSDLSLDQPIRDLVEYHLWHAKKSHNMQPVVRCEFKLEMRPEGRDDLQIKRCTLEKHEGEVKHQFQW